MHSVTLDRGHDPVNIVVAVAVLTSLNWAPISFNDNPPNLMQDLKEQLPQYLGLLKVQASKHIQAVALTYNYQLLGIMYEIVLLC